MGMCEQVGRTALMRAAENGRQDVVEALVEAGADVEATDKVCLRTTLAGLKVLLMERALLLTRGEKKSGLQQWTFRDAVCKAQWSETMNGMDQIRNNR